MLKTNLIAVLSLICFSQSFSQWKEVHPSTPFKKAFNYALTIPSENIYYAAGGQLASSIDGSSWTNEDGFTTPVALESGALFQDLEFCNKQIGFLANKNIIYKTTDKGKSWTPKLILTKNPPKYESSAYFNAIQFTNSHQGYAVGHFAKIFRTTDGGETWDTLSISSKTAPFISYQDVSFVNDTVGYISGYEVSDILMNFGFEEFVMKTTDGGKTWSRSTLPTLADHRVLKLNTFGTDTIYTSLQSSQSSPEIFRSSDAGKSWQKVTPPQLTKITFTRWADANSGVTYVQDGFNRNQLLYTSDRGDSWKSATLPLPTYLTNNLINDIQFLNKNNGIIVGKGGLLLITTDAGKTWTTKNEAYPDFVSMDFVSSETGYASSGIGLYKTTDGGNHWTFQDKSDTLNVYKIKFDNKDNGLFYGYYNNCYHITQDGTKIDSLKIPYLFYFSNDFFSKGDSIFAAGALHNPTRLSFLSSGDKGKTWTETTLSTGPSSALKLLQTPDNSFYIGTPEHLYKSDNGGKSFQVVSDFNYMQQFCFLNNDTVLALQTDGKLMRSTDKGSSWSFSEDFSNPRFVNDFIAINNNTVYAYGSLLSASGQNGVIWKSEDGGLTWNEEPLPTSIEKAVLKMSKGGNYLYATGVSGHVLKLELLPDIITSSRTSVSQALSVFPLPAKDALNIKMENKDAIKTIEVYSNTSLLIDKLTRISSEHLVTIEVSHLPAGIYHLKILTETASYTKMIMKQ